MSANLRVVAKRRALPAAAALAVPRRYHRAITAHVDELIILLLLLLLSPGVGHALQLNRLAAINSNGKRRLHTHTHRYSQITRGGTRHTLHLHTRQQCVWHQIVDDQPLNPQLGTSVTVVLPTVAALETQ